MGAWAEAAESTSAFAPPSGCVTRFVIIPA